MLIMLVAIFSGLCLASVLYLFNKKQHYGKALTTTLFILRTLAVTLVILLFFNPYLKRKTNKVEPATIIIAQDNSNSLTLTKDSSFYKNEYVKSLDTLISQLEKNYVTDKYLFGNDVRELDSIDFNDYYTDFHQVLDYLKKNYYKKNLM